MGTYKVLKNDSEFFSLTIKADEVILKDNRINFYKGKECEEHLLVAYFSCSDYSFYKVEETKKITSKDIFDEHFLEDLDRINTAFDNLNKVLKELE